MAGLGFSNPIEGGIFPCCMANTVFINPAIPAAAVKCPILLLIEPMAQCLFSEALPKIKCRPSISIGSPKGVAVPCASI